jgi:hypothetical protein
MEAVEGATVACFEMLARLAGRAPDGLVAACRQWLAEERLAEVARAVGYAAVAHRLLLREADLVLLGELMRAAGDDTMALSMVELADLDPTPMWTFSADPPRQPGAERRPGARAACLDDTSPDRYDRAVLDAAATMPRIRALWRVWRSPTGGAAWPEPRRVYLVETGQLASLVQVTATVQRALVEVGEVDPQVEAYPVRCTLHSYQYLARQAGALLWTSNPTMAWRRLRLR